MDYKHGDETIIHCNKFIKSSKNNWIRVLKLFIPIMVIGGITIAMNDPDTTMFEGDVFGAIANVCVFLFILFILLFLMIPEKLGLKDFNYTKVTVSNEHEYKEINEAMKRK